MMGPGIAVTLARGGINCVILSRSNEGAQRGLRVAHEQFRLLVEHGLAAEAGAGSITSCTRMEDCVPAADLVIESAPESMQLKQELFVELESIAKPNCILASNTSGLSITDIASKCANPERVVTTHFWNPPYLMPLVEIVKGARTSDDVVATLRELLRLCGKTPVVVKKDKPGQLGNRLQHALVREAMHIVQEGIADVEDVDLAAMTGFGLRLPVYGIFEHQDAVGLDMATAVLDYISQDLSNTRGVPEVAQRLVAEGNLGAKTGKGFYDWSKKDINEVRARRDRFVLEFLKRK
jgi:3-hydroxybutyryl-CoA dehydrogenase